MSRDIVLLGGGHAHALLIRALVKQPIDAARVTLISERVLTPYSGMLPGYIAGHYAYLDTHINLAALCRAAKVRWIEATATGLDLDNKQVLLAGRPGIHYDWLSLDTGSAPSVSIAGAAKHAVGVKPVSGFKAQWDRLREHRSRPRSIAVVGAGAGGVELVLAMAQYFRADPTQLHLVYPGDEVLRHYPSGVRRSAEAALARHNVQCHPNFSLSEVQADALIGSDGQRLAIDDAVLCTAAAAPDWPAAAGLAVDDRGFVAVDEQLQSVSHPGVFAAGDIASMGFDPRPKAGVYAVRQAPYLLENLRRSVAGEALKPIRLQRDFLSLVSLGDQRAVGSRAGFALEGAWVWRLKDRIDRAFMDNIASASDMAPMAGPMATPMEAMHCAGCGSKLGPELLADTLAELAEQYPQVLSNADIEDAVLIDTRRSHGGGDHSEPGDEANAATSPGSSDRVNAEYWQSFDGFRSFDGDLYRFGCLAVIHALSDIYAMGALPSEAQVWVNTETLHPRLQRRDFAQLMHGIVAELAAADCMLAGGHSTEGNEVHIGVVAGGWTTQGRRWNKRGMQPGDALVLTKPLGTGVALAAAMQGDNRAEAAAWASMLQSNRAAALAAQDYTVNAATDVTGFGLLGHLREMLDNKVAVDVMVDRVATLPGVREAFEAGYASSLAPSLSAAMVGHPQWESLPPWQQGLLCDPQTSGGLLLAMPSAAADTYCQAVETAHVIAHVVEMAGVGDGGIRFIR